MTHKPKKPLHDGLSRSVSHATRSAKQKEPPPEFLTKDQWETQRRAEEAEERKKIRKLREEYNAYEQSVRTIRFSKPPCTQ